MNTTDYLRGALVITVGLLVLCRAEDVRKRQFGADDDSLGFGNSLFGTGGGGKLQDWQNYFTKRIALKRGLGSSQHGFGSTPWSNAKLQNWKNYFARSARLNGAFGNGGFGTPGLGEGAGKFQSWNGGLFKRDTEETKKH